jgi:hypothetical protein
MQLVAEHAILHRILVKDSILVDEWNALRRQLTRKRGEANMLVDWRHERSFFASENHQ